MSQAPRTTIRSCSILGILSFTALIAIASTAVAADGCPTTADDISTDRPDVTNSNLVVPYFEPAG